MEILSAGTANHLQSTVEHIGLDHLQSTVEHIGLDHLQSTVECIDAEATSVRTDLEIAL